MDKPQATTLTTMNLIDGDPEIESMEVRVTLKPGIKNVSSTLHLRAVGLFLVQNQDRWMKFCIDTKNARIT
jgi:hypothetical protein